MWRAKSDTSKDIFPGQEVLFGRRLILPRETDVGEGPLDSGRAGPGLNVFGDGVETSRAVKKGFGDVIRDGIGREGRRMGERSRGRQRDLDVTWAVCHCWCLERPALHEREKRKAILVKPYRWYKREIWF